MSLELIKTHMNNGGEHLGDLLWWSIADATIARTDFVRIWSANGLDLGLLPEAPSAERALKQAVRDAQLGQREYLVRLGKEDEQQIIFAVVHEYRRDDGTVHHRQEAAIVLDRRRQHLTADVLVHPIVQAVDSQFHRLRDLHTADDVRRAVLNTLRTFAAVTLRDRGGVYWVPAPFVSHLRLLQRAVEQIGCSRLYLVPVSKTPDAEATLAEVAQGSLEAELHALRDEIRHFITLPPARTSTLVRRLGAFDELRGRARVYRDVLSVEVTDLDRQLDELSTTVEGLIGAKEGAIDANPVVAIQATG